LSTCTGLPAFFRVGLIKLDSMRIFHYLIVAYATILPLAMELIDIALQEIDMCKNILSRIFQNISST
jgi:hypothetical protein